MTAEHYGLVCLLHEKPFAGINGSGKHNNWSMSTDTGENLLEPGQTPRENMRFVVFLTAVIRAVDLHADLLRVAIAHAGNDHRLGANEAPPAIISIYLGEQLAEVVESLVAGAPAGRGGERKKESMRLGVTTLPPLPKDATDRNRTSPFAFTGNKFEFRAVGSSQAIAKPNTMLNTIVADSLAALADQIDRLKGQKGLESAVQEVVQAELKQHQRVIFGGNGYSPEWHAEAERRGLPNIRNAVDAIGHYSSAKNVQMFERLGVLTHKEAESRTHIMYEHYSKAIAVEGQSCLSIARTMVLPAAQVQQQNAATSVAAAKALGLKVDAQERRLKQTTALIEQLVAGVDDLSAQFEHAEAHTGSPKEHAQVYRDKVVPAMARIRETVDGLESMVADELWPLPKYREMLFQY